MMPMAEFELKLLRGQISGLPSEAYEKHSTAVEFALLCGVEAGVVARLLSAAVLRTDDEILAFDLSEGADPDEGSMALSPEEFSDIITSNGWN